ncbi:hypothetical protein COOONC_10308 [Cooperia oncophora]
MSHFDDSSRARHDRSSETLDSESIRQMLEDGELDTMRWEDDDIALRSAASNSRLPYDKLTAQELLQLWHLEPNVELTSEDAIENLPIPFNTALVLTSKRKRVIIIGAGAAGIAALKQLHFFGFDVTLLEARKRLGGRVHTYHQKDSSIVADLGAMVVTGINGNPIVTMMRQTQCTPIRIAPDCPIYDEYGKLVDQRKDELVAEAFKKLVDISVYNCTSLHVY